MNETSLRILVISSTSSPIFASFFCNFIFFPRVIQSLYVYLILYHDLKNVFNSACKIKLSICMAKYIKFDERIVGFGHHALLFVQILRLAFTCHLQSHAHNAGKIHKTPSKKLVNLTKLYYFFLSFSPYVIFKWYCDE